MRYLHSFYSGLLHACVQLHRCLYGDLLSVCIFHASLSCSRLMYVFFFLIVLDIIARSFFSERFVYVVVVVVVVAVRLV